MSYLFRSRMSTETDIQKLNSAVDESFDKGTLIRIRVSAVRIFFIGVVLVAVYFAYYWSQVAAQAALANLLELSVSLDALATAIAALGLVMFGMVLGRDWKDSEREQAERLHYKKLVNFFADNQLEEAREPPAYPYVPVGAGLPPYY